MILAAGRGERLKPITEIQPKALCRINDEPVIKYHLINLAKAGFEKVIINHSYLGWKIKDYISGLKDLGLEIIFCPEPPGGLETGGGIFNALSYFKNNHFLVINADVYTDFDLTKVKKPTNSLAHIILYENTKLGPGDFGILNNKVINEKREFIFTGIGCYHAEMFNSIEPGRYSLTPILRNLANTNQLHGEIHTGTWFDIGTVEQLKLAILNKTQT